LNGFIKLIKRVKLKVTGALSLGGRSEILDSSSLLSPAAFLAIATDGDSARIAQHSHRFENLARAAFLVMSCM
jgi:hypothetical protein